MFSHGFFIQFQQFRYELPAGQFVFNDLFSRQIARSTCSISLQIKGGFVTGRYYFIFFFPSPALLSTNMLVARFKQDGINDSVTGSLIIAVTYTLLQKPIRYWSRSQDLLGDFLIISLTSLVEDGGNFQMSVLGNVAPSCGNSEFILFQTLAVFFMYSCAM